VRRRNLTELLASARAGEWWEHKLAPVAGTGYATAVMAHGRLTTVAGTVALTVGALAVCAAYVSVLNDLTDREADRIAGKPNRLAGRPAPVCAAVVALPIALGLATAVLVWRGDPLLAGLYAGAWLAFTLYSAPGVRLKGRGIAGVLGDAAGAHLFPQLLVAAAVLRHLHAELDPAWLAAVGVWSLAAGARGALWHQLGDVEADARARVRTFARADPRRAERVGRFVAFPAELAGLLAMLVLAPGVAAAVLLVPYVVFERRRAVRWLTPLIVVSPAPRNRLVMHDYYVAVYPLAFAMTAVVRHPADAVVLAAQLALFPRTSAQMAADGWTEVREGMRARLRPSPARSG
jgi:4-hydroxybenzoate polyprenyltransferase